MEQLDGELLVTGTVPVTPEIASWERDLLLDVVKRAACMALASDSDDGPTENGDPDQPTTTHIR